MAPLATTRFGSPSASTVVLMLHGIYGRGRNWAAIARGVVAARPGCACLVIDLPHHGDSGPGAHGDSVRGLAADVIAGARVDGTAAAVVVGHSFGGKVALAIADHWRDRPLRCWVVDATPGARAPSGSAWDLLQAVRALPATFASRDAFVTALTGRGWAPAVARWMATNLQRQGSAFVWRLDFDVMERLLIDFFATDLWSVVERPAPGHVIHFIKATESSVMSDEAVRRVEQSGSGRVHVHHLAGGHWIHAERPDEVVELLARDL